MSQLLAQPPTSPDQPWLPWLKPVASRTYQGGGTTPARHAHAAGGGGEVGTCQNHDMQAYKNLASMPLQTFLGSRVAKPRVRALTNSEK